MFGWRGDDRRSFALCVTAVIVASPIVWVSHFPLLLAPIAVMRPRRGVVWLLPLLMWVGPFAGNGSPW